MKNLPEKTCMSCGRRIVWRSKWAASWDEVRYCSDACRRRKGKDPADRELEIAILSLLAERKAGASICPSEAARMVFPEEWNAQMERTRQAARRLVAANQILITQGGHVVDPSLARGPIRLKLAPVTPVPVSLVVEKAEEIPANRKMRSIRRNDSRQGKLDD